MLEPLKINLGCGTNVLDGWVNIDLEPGPGVLVHDLGSGIPLGSNSVSMVYCDNLIQEMYPEDVEFIFRECGRVMLKGSILRIVTPDINSAVISYLKKEGSSPAREMNRFFNVPKTKFVWDWESLSERLRASGFYYSYRCRWSASILKEMRNLESTEKIGHLIVEAKKSL